MKHLLLLIVLITTGCQENGRVVDGVFSVDGQPRGGVKVYLHGELTGPSSCGGAPLSAITNDAGEFSAVVHKFPITPCFIFDGTAYSTFLIVDDGTQDQIHLDCRLPLVVTGHFEDGHICYPRHR